MMSFPVFVFFSCFCILVAFQDIVGLEGVYLSYTMYKLHINIY